MDEQQQDQLRYLFARYVNNLSMRAEYDAFLKLVEDSESDDELKSLLAQLWEELDQNPTKQPQRKTGPTYLWLITTGIAATLLVSLAIGFYFSRPQASTEGSTAEQLKPVQQGVTLQLANGQTIQLNKKYHGQIQQAHATQQDSSIRYTQNESLAEEKNTLSNNGNEKFSVTLSDGTEAMLDIGSSLTYPTAFNKTNAREVTLTGQGYFKVKHQSTRFLVHYNNETTEDLGTEFNIEAYPDETAITTLIEGSIKVNDHVLQPGQQFENNVITTADLEATTAWLQDHYVFNNEPLGNIMNWVSRIYGVKVVYQDDKLRRMTFGGSFNRRKKLASVLNFFRQTGGVDFRVEGQTITVFQNKTKK